MPQTAPELADRYGTPARRSGPFVVAVAAVLVAGAIAWLLWATLFHARPQVTSEMVGFDVAGEHEVTATFTVVRRDAEVSATCLLRAYAEDHSVVGELSVPVASDADRSATLRSSVRTERRATTVELVGCTAAGQNQPR